MVYVTQLCWCTFVDFWDKSYRNQRHSTWWCMASWSRVLRSRLGRRSICKLSTWSKVENIVSTWSRVEGREYSLDLVEGRGWEYSLDLVEGRGSRRGRGEVDRSRVECPYRLPYYFHFASVTSVALFSYWRVGNSGLSVSPIEGLSHYYWLSIAIF